MRIRSGQSILQQAPQGQQAPNVDPNKSYVDGRSVENLKKVGGVDSASAAMLERIDGIIANQPKNGRPEVDEFLTMERPEFQQTLFPEEQAAGRNAWRFLEVTPLGAIPPAITIAPLEVTRELVMPREFRKSVDENKPYFLSYLVNDGSPTSERNVARRVQLIANGDANPETLCLADLQKALAVRERFLETEVHVMERLVEKLTAFATSVDRTPTDTKAVVRFPPAGTQETPIPYGGQVKLSVVSKTEVYSRPDEIWATRTSSLQAEVPAGCKAILLNLDNDEEILLNEGKNQLPRFPGRYAVELWKDGQRIESAAVQLPKLPEGGGWMQGEERVSVGTDLPGYKILAGDQVLAKNYPATAIPPGMYALMDFTGMAPSLPRGLLTVIKDGPVMFSFTGQPPVTLKPVEGRLETEFVTPAWGNSFSPHGNLTCRLVVHLSGKVEVHSPTVDINNRPTTHVSEYPVNEGSMCGA